MKLLGLRQPRNTVNLTVHQTSRAGQRDRRMLSALYRAMDRAAKSDFDGKDRAIDRLLNLTQAQQTERRKQFIEKLKLRSERFTKLQA